MATEPYPGFAADLDLVVSRTRHGRYRLLTDPARPEYHAGYVEVVRSEAARLRGEATPVAARAAKPRGSLDDAIRARRDCIPCREEEARRKARGG